MLEKIKEKAMDTVKKMKKNGEEDPRRIVHSVKVGIAITLMSLFYYFRPLYHGFGEAGMWAILTVVVVFEFTVGGTISKGVNRGLATLVAAALGVGAEYLANECGDKGEPIVLGLLVFMLAAMATFVRFFPHVKRKYDYGVLVFILTFSLVAVSGARASEIWKMAHQRLTTILIGGATCMAISLCICPVWAGQDLHNLIAANIEKLAAFLEGFGRHSCVAPDNGEDKTYLHEIVPILVVASVLIDIIKFVEKISVSVNELSQKAGFKEHKATTATISDKQYAQVLHRGIVKPVDEDEQVVIDIVEIKTNSTEIKNPLHPTQS